MRLLIIDDEEDICDLIAELAQRRGFEVRFTTDADAVTTVLGEFTPDIIMMDLMMPGIDGVELLRLLAARARQAKLCLISGSDARVLNSARRLGSAHGLDVVDAMEKPLSVAGVNGLFDQLTASAAPSKDDHLGALKSGQFLLHYQPIIDLQTRAVKGVEALTRWKHPDRGFLAAEDFITQIAEAGQMQNLTDFVIGSGIRQAGAWRKHGERFTLSMNVTASTLLDLSLPDRIADLCKQNDVPTETLILEVTETEAMRDVTRTMDVLLRMRLRNIGVSIDDFGTGHSSLRELQRMPFSEMKIDKSFIVDMARTKDSAVIVRSIVELGHNLGLKIIAEGIESQELWDALQGIKCDYGQGFFMARPMAPAELNRWLEIWRQK